MESYHMDQHGSPESLIEQGYRRISNKYRMVSKVIASPEEQFRYLKSLNVKIKGLWELANWYNWLCRVGDDTITHKIWDIPYEPFKLFPVAQ